MADKPATVAKPNSPVPLEDYNKLVERLKVKSSATAMFSRERAFELASQSVNRIVQATTADDLFDASEKGSGLQSMGDDDWPHRNNPINLLTVEFQKSESRYEEGTLGHYAIVNYALDDGEVFSVGCGAPQVVAFLDTWERLSKAEQDKASRVKIVGKVTSRGELLRVTRP